MYFSSTRTLVLLILTRLTSWSKLLTHWSLHSWFLATHASVSNENPTFRLYDLPDGDYCTLCSCLFTLPDFLHQHPSLLCSLQCCIADSLQFRFFLCIDGYTMDTLKYEWLDNPVNVDSHLQMTGHTLRDTALFDCSQNYTSGSFPCLKVVFHFQSDGIFSSIWGGWKLLNKTFNFACFNFV